MKIHALMTCAACIAFLSINSPARASDSLGTGSDLRMLFRANGQVTIGYQLYGMPRYSGLPPGYRSDLQVYSDLVSCRGIIFDFLTGATTCIARTRENPIKLDRIEYTLSPGLRYAFRKTMVTGLLFHECIHTLSREEPLGATWWNSLQLGAGTLGAYHFYFIEKYNNRDFSLRNSLDAQINAGWYLHGASPWIGQNHPYRADVFGLVRYHFGLFRNQTFFVDIKPHLWYDTLGMVSGKLTAEVNYVILAHDNIATLYFSHCFKDDNPYDNEFSVGTLGLRFVF
jgi:hypothetical protein